jgi:pimeloyl-ACP methyl ester carboxylesterase
MEHLVADVVAGARPRRRVGGTWSGHDWAPRSPGTSRDGTPTASAHLTAVSVPHPLAFAHALRPTPTSAHARSTCATGGRPETEQALLDGGLEQVFGGIPAVDGERYPGGPAAARGADRLRSATTERSRCATSRGSVRVTAPTLHVWSDQDPPSGRRPAHATGDHVAGPYRFEVLQGVSHWVPEQAPDRLSALLLEHLR